MEVTNQYRNPASVKIKLIKRLAINLYMRGKAIYIKISLNGKSIAFSSGLNCNSSKLNKSLFTVEGDEITTNLLQAIRTDLQRTYSDFELTKRFPDLREIRDIALSNKSHRIGSPTLIECLDKFLIEEFEQLEGIEYEKKTVDKKRFLVERIKRYLIVTYGNRYIQISDIRPIDASNLVNFCKKTFGHGHNHAVLHAEFLKRTFNYAIANEWIDKNPFVFFKPRREIKSVVALKEWEVKKLENTSFNGYEYNLVKDVFLFCCYTGLAYIDVSRLNYSHIYDTADSGKIIRILRGKNGNQCIIPLVDSAQKLISKYSDNPDCTRKNRLLPVYSNQAMNRILKEIQSISEISIRLTMHVSRKTFISYYASNGMPLISVASMAGHNTTSTTEKYYTQRSEHAVIEHFQEFQKRKNP